MQTWLPALAAFLGTLVEGVEALTVVLAVGATAGWSAALRGAGAGLALLVAIVALCGPALVTVVPLDVLRVVVGIFLLLLGLEWLRKGVLRYGGRKALRDEAAAFARTRAQVDAGGALARNVGFALAFKSTVLEGLESVIIVITIGASGGAAGLTIATTGALAALAVVTLLGIALHRPLGALSDNAIKTFAGVMITTFGTFWTGEGLGVRWWHDDLSIPLLALVFIAVAALAIARLRRTPGTVARATP